MSAPSSPSPSPQQQQSEVRAHPWTGNLIVRLPPSERRPSPPPLKAVDRPVGSGWDSEPPSPGSWDYRRRPRPTVDPVWSFDAQDFPAGWLKADSTAAAIAFNAAYDDALQWGDRIRRLNVQWHREDQYNMKMYGRGPRGDIAPDAVHIELDRLLATHPPLAQGDIDCLHARLDVCWLRHSRSPPRLPVSLHDLRLRSGVLTVEDMGSLSRVIFENCLDDFREVMICVDPRATIIYGRTRETQGISRRWHSFGPRGHPPSDAVPYELDGRSEISGSSADECEATVPPYPLSRTERAYQLHRHAGRDYGRVMAEVDRLKDYTRSLRQREEELKREISRRGSQLSELEDKVRELRILQDGTPEPPF